MLIDMEINKSIVAYLHNRIPKISEINNQCFVQDMCTKDICTKLYFEWEKGSQNVNSVIYYGIKEKKVVKMIEEYANRSNGISNIQFLKLNCKFSGVYLIFKLITKILPL